VLRLSHAVTLFVECYATSVFICLSSAIAIVSFQEF